MAHMYTHLDLPRGAEWMVRGAYTPFVRVQTAPFGRCWHVLFTCFFFQKDLEDYCDFWFSFMDMVIHAGPWLHFQEPSWSKIVNLTQPLKLRWLRPWKVMVGRWIMGTVYLPTFTIKNQPNVSWLVNLFPPNVTPSEIRGYWGLIQRNQC